LLSSSPFLVTKGRSFALICLNSVSAAFGATFLPRSAVAAPGLQTAAALERGFERAPQEFYEIVTEFLTGPAVKSSMIGAHSASAAQSSC
jgi:hypothetical protein